jgi:hypothetical protein
MNYVIATFKINTRNKITMLFIPRMKKLGMRPSKLSSGFEIREITKENLNYFFYFETRT